MEGQCFSWVVICAERWRWQLCIVLLSRQLTDRRYYSFFSLLSLFLFLPTQQAFNATAVVRHMRKLQLGTSLEGPSQITPTSPCRGHLLPEEEGEEEEDDLGNGEEESCKSAARSIQMFYSSESANAEMGKCI